MSKITDINAIKAASSNCALLEAVEQDFESVMIFGFKDNQIHVISSRVIDTIKMMGALEAAKMQLWENE